MFIDSVMGGEYTYANPDLKPETSDNFEVGARWDGRWASVDAALFYNKTDDYITSVTIGEVNGVDASEMQNVSEATTFGLEMAVNMRPFECGLAPYTSFTVMRRVRASMSSRSISIFLKPDSVRVIAYSSGGNFSFWSISV